MDGKTSTVVDRETASSTPLPERRSGVFAPVVVPCRWLRVHMTDEWSVAVIGTILSIAFYKWYDAHGLTVAFNDARIRELIARRVVMGRTPGLAQLGTTWLPLPFMLMVPLIWNETLFRDGLAGSIPSMLSYVIGGLYLYRIGRLLSSRSAGWVAAAVLMLNPSVAYMQTTPMSEIPSLGAFIISIYYALRLVISYHALDVVKCATAVAAGTLIRYENWFLAMGLLPLLAYVAWRHRGYEMAEAWAILYGLLAFAGCAAWMIYNWVIFHDPLLAFFYGQSDHQFSAHTPSNLLPARHNARLALETYGLTVADTVGWALVAIAAIGFAALIARRRLARGTLPVYVSLLPFVFYWLVLYEGVNRETIPPLVQGSLYNIRFGLAMIPAIAIGIVGLTITGPVLVKRALAWAGLAVVIASSVIGTVHTPFVVREAMYGAQGIRTEEPGRVDANWLSAHYHGGNILITYVNSPAIMFYLLAGHGIPDRALITDANGPQFAAALARPADWVTWIVINSDRSNGKSKIWAALHGRADWRRYFVLRRTSGTTHIYQRRSGNIGPGGNRSTAPDARGRSRHRRMRAGKVLIPVSAREVGAADLNAVMAIDKSQWTAWETHWHVGDPVFGGLHGGSGLMLDMGHQVRLRSVQARFGSPPGANVQIEIGDRSLPTGATAKTMTTVAHANDIGGVHTFLVRDEVTGRYVLIWFTKLPPAAGTSGSYPAEIFNIIVRGRRLPRQ